MLPGPFLWDIQGTSSGARRAGAREPVRSAQRGRDDEPGMLSLLNPKWVLFVKVSELGSVSRAAAALNTPQSIVSRHIGELERECDNKLFRRTGRGVVLTDFGRLVYPRVKSVMAEAEQALDEINTAGGAPMGEVRVGLLPATVPLLASKLFNDVRELFPLVRIRFVEGSSAQLDEWVAEGRVDFSLLHRVSAELDVNETVIARQQLHLVGSRSDPRLDVAAIALTDIQDWPLTIPGRPHYMRSILDSLEHDKGLHFDIVVETDSIRLQHAIVGDSNAYGMMFGPLAPADTLHLTSIPLIEPAMSRVVVISQATQRPHTLATREVSRRLITLATHLLNL